MAKLTAPQGKIPIHPLAEAIPAMSEDEFRDLCKSFRDNGFIAKCPIVLFEGKILDGRHRYRACLKEGVEPQFTDFVGPDPEAFVYAMSNRRNLSETTRGLLAARVLEQQRGKAAHDRLEHEDVRKMFGVGETVVTECVRVIKNATPELVAMMENGEVQAKQAAEIIRLDKAEQKKVVAAGPKAVAAKASQIRKVRRLGGPVPPASSGKPFAVPDRQFDPETAEILTLLKTLAGKLTKYIQHADGKRFEQYVRDIGIPGWIDYSGVKLTDKGDGLKKEGPKFTAFQSLYRLIVAAARNRAFPISQLKKMVEEKESNVLDLSSPPPEPENDPAQLVPAQGI